MWWMLYMIFAWMYMQVTSKYSQNLLNPARFGIYFQVFFVKILLKYIKMLMSKWIPYTTVKYCAPTIIVLYAWTHWNSVIEMKLEDHK